MGYVYIPQSTDLLSGCACAIIFIFLLFLDALKAHARKASWFPRGFLVLSSVTLQFINYVDYSCVNLTPGMENIKDEDVENFLKIQLVIDSGRLVICVFIAYLLPGLACSGFSVGSDIGALALSVLTHIHYEVLLFAHVPHKLPVSIWVPAFNATVVIAISFLVLLSISAVVAGKTIRIMMNEKVSSLLECCNSNSPTPCRSIGDHVLKCWIIARCSQPEYVVARSVLSSFACLLVAVCIIVFGVKWKSVYSDDYETLPRLNKATLGLQVAFVIAGCIVVVVRCLTAVRYFPIGSDVEDFWTRSIIDFKYVQLKRPLSSEARDRPRTALESNFIDLKFELLSFVSFIASIMQNWIVSISKASFFLTSIIFCPINLFCGSNNQESEFPSYGAFLERIKMPGEMTGRLLRANESAFRSTKRHMDQGSRNNAEMINIIRHRRQLAAADGGEEIQVEEEKYFKYVGKKSWKMEAVSLIHLMLSLYDDANSEAVDNAFKACYQAWALMDLVETSDTEVNLFTLAADKEFHSLEKIWKKMRPVQPERVRTTRRDKMRRDIQSRISKAESSHQRVDTMHDSMDWIMTAANFSLRKTSQKVHYDSPQAMVNSESLLADVIRDCLTEARNKTIIEKCNKWAVDGNEQDIYHAAFIAGIVMSVEDASEISRDNNAVPPDVAARNNATEENETYEDASETPVDTTAGEITTTVVAENGNNATVPDGEENEPRYGEPLEILVHTIA